MSDIKYCTWYELAGTYDVVMKLRDGSWLFRRREGSAATVAVSTVYIPYNPEHSPFNISDLR